MTKGVKTTSCNGRFAKMAGVFPLKNLYELVTPCPADSSERPTTSASRHHVMNKLDTFVKTKVNNVMKAKQQILIFLCFFFIVSQGYGQYQSIFGDSTTQFNILEYCRAMNTKMKKSNIIGTTTKYHIGNDTIIEHQLYKKITCEDGWYYDHSSLYSGIREDTIAGKIFVYGETFGEMLTCDFSLTVGDTFFFHQYNPCGGLYDVLNADNGFMVVDSIYFMDGKKIITFNGPYYWYEYSGNKFVCKYNLLYYFSKLAFVEGVGPNYGILGWYCEQRMLLCSSKDNNLIYMQREDLGCEHDDCGSGVGERSKNNVIFYPNPTSDQLRIKNEELKYNIFL